jgi:RNA polymerase sigma-70 factor, ECF subfamily
VTSRPDHEHRRALEELYLRHERGLYNIAYRYVWNRDDALDVVHDAFVRMWRKRDRIDWERAAGLAYRTVLGLASNRRRTRAVRALLTPLVAWGRARDDRPDALLAAAEDDAAVRRGIERLPERLRSVLVMCTFTELDYAAIGEILELPAGTVGSRRTEAVARLRAELSHG